MVTGAPRQGSGPSIPARVRLFGHRSASVERACVSLDTRLLAGRSKATRRTVFESAEAQLVPNVLGTSDSDAHARRDLRIRAHAQDRGATEHSSVPAREGRDRAATQAWTFQTTDQQRSSPRRALQRLLPLPADVAAVLSRAKSRASPLARHCRWRFRRRSNPVRAGAPAVKDRRFVTLLRAFLRMDCLVLRCRPPPRGSRLLPRDVKRPPSPCVTRAAHHDLVEPARQPFAPSPSTACARWRAKS